MSERKLATVRRIADIAPIEGADKIVCVTVDGWKLVSGKENGFKVGDLVLYFEIDSFLPVIPAFEWMRDRCYKKTENLGEGFLVRTIKLRGQVSQGLIVPLDDFFEKDETGFYYEDYTDDQRATLERREWVDPTKFYLEEGSDVTHKIGVKKYEKPVPASMSGKAAGSFPSFIHKTDQERIQNCFGGVKKWIFFDKPLVTEVTEPDLIRDLEALRDDATFVQKTEGAFFKSGDVWFNKSNVRRPQEEIDQRNLFEATLKMDGTSMTAYYLKEKIGVCSRNYDLERDEGVYWDTAMASGLLAVLATLGIPMAIQGELMGPGIQGNREKLDHPKLFVFDIFDIERGVYLAPNHRRDLFHALSERLDLTYIDHVPLIAEQILITEDCKVDDFLGCAEKIKSLNHDIAEGIVYKSLVEGGPSFKAINNKFLLKETD